MSSGKLSGIALKSTRLMPYSAAIKGITTPMAYLDWTNAAILALLNAAGIR
jgi:hypothetical protein